MRFYDIQISGKATRRYTSYVNGKTDLGALNVELDLQVNDYTFMPGSVARVWGISIQDIGQASDLNKSSIQISGGMKAGLPLANPAQSGLLAQGTIQQAFGNWQGTSMTLDLILIPDGGSSSIVNNIVFVWAKGQQLAPAIQSALTTAFPSSTVKVNVGSQIVATETQTGFYNNLKEFSKYIEGASGGSISISRSGSSLIVYDGLLVTAPKGIAFTDLIGQATWIGYQTISVKTVMRYDISVGSMIKLPQGQVVTTAESYSQYRQGSIFQGKFLVTSVRHVGNFRQLDANSWVTIIEAVLNGGQ